MSNNTSTPPNAGPTATSNIAAKIAKDVASVLRDMFDAFVRNTKRSTVLSFQPTHPFPSAPDFTVYNVTVDHNTSVYGTDVYPASTPEQLIRGYIKHNECDFAAMTLFCSLQRRLNVAVPGAIVEWVNFPVKNEAPLIKFRVPSWKDEVSHSAFVITLPTTPGEEPRRFVADFTIEQYGQEEWWVEFDEYMRKMKPEGSNFAFLKNESEESLGFDEQLKGEAKFLRGLCAKLDWSALGNMDEEERREALFRFVSEQMASVLRGGRGEGEDPREERGSGEAASGADEP